MHVKCCTSLFYSSHSVSHRRRKPSQHSSSARSSTSSDFVFHFEHAQSFQPNHRSHPIHHIRHMSSNHRLHPTHHIHRSHLLPRLVIVDLPNDVVDPTDLPSSTARVLQLESWLLLLMVTSFKWVVVDRSCRSPIRPR